MSTTFITRDGKKILLRRPEAADLAALFAYAKKLEAEDTFVTLNPDEPLTYAEQKGYLAKLIKRIEDKKELHFVAFDKDEIVAAINLSHMGRRKNHVGRLGIAVLSKYRAAGLGRFMVEHLFYEAKHRLKIRMIQLEVFSINSSALRFYKSMGFIMMGVLPENVFYKGAYIDEYYMYKKLE